MKSNTNVKMIKDARQSFHAHTITTENIFTKQTQFRIFSKEAPCVEYIQKNENLHLFGEDMSAKMHKQFYAINYNTIYLLSKMKKFHLYEYYGNDEEVKLFLDIDIKPEHIPETADKKILFDNIINDSIKLMVEKLEKDYQIIDPAVIILKSSSDVKLSSHVIFPDVVFRNIKEMKFFVTEIKSLYITKGIIDPCVYRKGAFRCLWNSKYGKNINLEFYKGIRYEQPNEKEMFYDCLLRCINQDYYVVEVEMPVNVKIIKAKNIRKVGTKKIKDAYGIEINGENENISHPISSLKPYLDILNKNKADAYDTWLKVGMILHNCNPDSECFDMWDEWSKDSPNYTSRDYNAYKWNSFDLGHYTIASLKYYAKKDNPDAYPEVGNNIGHPIFESINFESPYLLSNENESIKENKSFVSSHIIDWMENSDIKTLAIRSCYNSGKTDIIRKIIKEFDPKKILFVSYRQTLTHELYGNFQCLNVKSYFDKEYDSDRIICQIESLPKLLPPCAFDSVNILNCYDLIILDEIESILNHFVSTTIENKEFIFKLMSNLIFNASKVLALDGDFHNRSYNFLEKFGGIKILKNTIQKDKRNYIFTNNRNDIDTNIEKDLEAKKNLVIVSMSSKIATFLYSIYKDKYKCILHTKYSNDSDKKNLQNVKEYWKEAQMVIYSPSIESGVNFDIEHFDKIYMMLSPKSTSARGLLQMAARVRKIKDNNIMVYLNNLPYKEKCNFYSYEEIKAYVFEVYGKFKKPIIKLDTESNKMVMGFEFDEHSQLIIHNQIEHANKTSTMFVAYLIKLLEEKGHTYEHRETRYSKHAFKKDTLLKDEILESKDINIELYNLLYKKMCDNKATREEKFMIEKFALKIDWKVEEITDDFLSKFLGKTHVLYNLRWLLDDTLMNEYFGENLLDKEFKMEQIKMIREVITKLGFLLPLDPNIILDKETFEKNIAEVTGKSKLFVDVNKSQPLFNFDKVKIGNVKNIKQFMGFINSLLTEWGLKIQMVRKIKNIIIDEKKTTKLIKTYKMLYINNIDKHI
jgi:hypothetical protein